MPPPAQQALAFDTKRGVRLLNPDYTIRGNPTRLFPNTVQAFRLENWEICLENMEEAIETKKREEEDQK